MGNIQVCSIIVISSTILRKLKLVAVWTGLIKQFIISGLSTGSLFLKLTRMLGGLFWGEGGGGLDIEEQLSDLDVYQRIFKVVKPKNIISLPPPPPH